MNAVALGRLGEARTAITEGRRVQPDLSLDLMQNDFGVSRPTIDARRNTALRETGLSIFSTTMERISKLAAGA